MVYMGTAMRALGHAAELIHPVLREQTPEGAIEQAEAVVGFKRVAWKAQHVRGSSKLLEVEQDAWKGQSLEVETALLSCPRFCVVDFEVSIALPLHQMRPVLRVLDRIEFQRLEMITMGLGSIVKRTDPDRADPLSERLINRDAACEDPPPQPEGRTK